MKHADCTSIVINFALDPKASLAGLCIGEDELGPGYSKPDKQRAVRREKPGFEVAVQRKSATEARMKISRTGADPWEFADSLFAVNDAMHDLVTAGLVRGLPCDVGFGSTSPLEDQLQCTDLVLHFKNVESAPDPSSTALRFEGFPIEGSRFARGECPTTEGAVSLKVEITPDAASPTWVDIRAGLGATFRMLADRELHRTVDEDIAFVLEREAILARSQPRRELEGPAPQELSLQL